MDDKSLAMLVKGLGNIKLGDKENVKDFNQIFTHILNKFPTNVQPHDSITKDYFWTWDPSMKEVREKTPQIKERSMKCRVHFES